MTRKPFGRNGFFCSDCGYESLKWMGFCSSCHSNQPLVEAPSRSSSNRKGWINPVSSGLKELVSISYDIGSRISSGFQELDRVLGGGIVQGSIILVAGEPGIGKSTLLLQIAHQISLTKRTITYISGEESDHQIKLRADRLGISGENVFLLTETNVETIVEHLEATLPSLVIIDSVQTLSSSDIGLAPGSIPQVRTSVLTLLEWAKIRNIPILLSGHVTKDGTIAGPRVLEHMVDAVLYLEGEPLNANRIVHSQKNRFGSTNEVAMFSMESHGLKEIVDPSQTLLANRSLDAVGSSVVPTIGGSRPLMVEIQALTSPTYGPSPRRTANGIDLSRLVMITTVLTQRAHLNLGNRDVTVNVAGGLRIADPGCDLALALAIASCSKDLPIKQGLVAIGEVGLSGELRPVSQLNRRLQEASRLGFTSCILPMSAKHHKMQGLNLLFATTISMAIKIGLNNHTENRTL